MTTTPAAIDPARDQPRKPPPEMALRTYLFLRLGMVAVLAALALSVGLEIIRSDGCVQRSLSAYYYTPVRTVFVGALVALGLSMITLWGKTAIEDSCLNVSGMLAPVVAFVPTSDLNFCSIVTSSGDDLTDTAGKPAAAQEAAQEDKTDLVNANHDAVLNNIATLLAVIGLALVAIAVTVIVRKQVRTRGTTWAYSIPYAVAVVLWIVGTWLFLFERDWAYRHAHFASAVFLFVFVIVVVFANAYEKWRDRYPANRPGHKTGSARYLDVGRWGWAYLLLGLLMTLSAVVIFAAGKVSPDSSFGQHWVFILEATLISLFAVFWMLQTVDRRHEGAPDLPSLLAPTDGPDQEWPAPRGC